MPLSAMTLAVVAAISVPARADNPIVQTSYTADPAPMVYDGRLYLYTSHDEDVTVSNFYTMNDWHLYSTIDMVNWTDHGTPASLKTFNWSTDSAWAPQGVARNGKFYLYVPINNNSGAKIGVAVANNPAGPFTDPLGKALAQKDSANIDPTVFIDDDGQAYMYWGNGTLRWVKLNSDMISTSGNITNVSLSGFTEGPWFYKRGSLYYMVYAATSGTEKLSYATSSSPTGPWTTKGDIMGTGSTFTNHPGVVDYKGHSYLFYHNSALPGGNDYKRSVCVEEFTYGADGSIPKLTMSTKGPSGIAALDPFQQVEAETIAFSSGLKTQTCSDTGGGMNVTSISNGDYIKVKDVDFLDGVTSFDARVSSATSGAKIELHLDSQSGTLLGTCDVSSASSSSWTTKTCTVSGGSGKHDLFLKFVGGSGDLFKFNWWRFSGPTMPPDGGVGAGGAGGSTGPGTGGVGGGAGASPGKGGSGGGAGTTAGSGGSPGAGGTNAGRGGSTTAGSGGAPGAGGTTPGTGGSPGAGGTNAGRGGSPGAGGTTPGTGGSAVSSGGAGSGGSAGPGGHAGNTAAAGSGGNGTSGADPGGCGCQTGGGAGNGGLAAALCLFASVLGRRRRRR
jgi:MYXO-CTERM domain-containing protein